MSGEQLRRLLKEKGCNLSKLAESLSITPQTLNSRSNAKNVNTSFVEEIEKILKEPILSSNANAILIDNPQYMQVPFVPISAHAGFLTGYGDVVYIKELTTIPVTVDKEYKGNYLVFEVKGDSMFDGSFKSICNKDKILAREMKCDYWTSKLHFKDWYFVIAHKEYGIVVKQIIDHNPITGDITCHSINPDPEYIDFTINLADVKALFNVVRIVEREIRI